MEKGHTPIQVLQFADKMYNMYEQTTKEGCGTVMLEKCL